MRISSTGYLTRNSSQCTMSFLLHCNLRNLIPVLMVPLFLVASASAVRGVESAVPSFSQTYDRYMGLCRDPSAGRDRWLEVIRSFAAVRRNESAHTRSRSLFLAGRASFTLYAREGRIEDLDNAIRYFDEVKRITRHKSRVSAILRELRTIHQLRRTHAEGPARAREPSARAPVAPERSKARSASPLTPKLRIAGKGSDQRNSHALSDTRSVSGSARPSAVYQGNPFCPTRRPEPHPNLASTGSVRTDIKGGQTSYNGSLPTVSTSTPGSIEPGVASVPPRPIENKRTFARVHRDSCNSPESRWRLLRSFVVVIDPGHGGKDPGAVSPDGKLNEKDVTLYTARRLKKRLEQRVPGITVKLTRTDDQFLSLTQRTAAANSWNADLFISIHCNSYPDSSARGVETYYLSKAGSERAMRVAARENDISPARMSDLEATLLDLMMTSKKSESEKLADTVHQALTRYMFGRSAVGRDRGVKRGPFYVLLGATMPAILVECGYLSNSGDRRKLGNKRYLDSLARGMASGARTYLKGLGKEG